MKATPEHLANHNAMNIDLAHASKVHTLSRTRFLFAVPFFEEHLITISLATTGIVFPLNASPGRTRPSVAVAVIVSKKV